MLIEGIVRWAVQIPAALLMTVPLGVGAAGIWLAISGSQFISGVAMLAWFWYWARGGGMASRAAAISTDAPEARGV